MTKNPIIIKIADNDNVGVVTNSSGLSEGTLLDIGIRLSQFIPSGHKVALKTIAEGDKIIRYGQTIGYAIKSIEPGGWVNESKMLLPDPPELKSIPIPVISNAEINPLEGYTFEGYRNPDGSVGTKNVLGITTSVQCVAGITQYVVKKIKQNLLPLYPNVDDVVALNHSYGCGVAINVPSAIIPIRTIRNIATNPNFGGEVLVVGLGCEKLRPETLVPQNEDSTVTSDNKFSNILYLQDESLYGFNAMVEGVMEMANSRLKRLNARKRETCPVSDLVVGMQCGGSDAFSAWL